MGWSAACIMYSVHCVCVCWIPSSLWRGVWVIALRKPTQWVEPPTYTRVHPHNGGQQNHFPISHYCCCSRATLARKTYLKEKEKKSDKIDTAKAETTQNKAESKRLGASVKGNIQAWPKPGQSLCHNSHMHFFHSHLCCGSSQLVMGVQPTLSATRPAFCSHLMSDNPT